MVEKLLCTVLQAHHEVPAALSPMLWQNSGLITTKLSPLFTSNADQSCPILSSKDN